MKIKVKVYNFCVTDSEQKIEAEKELAELLLSGWKIISTGGNENGITIILTKEIMEVSG